MSSEIAKNATREAKLLNELLSWFEYFRSVYDKLDHLPAYQMTFCSITNYNIDLLAMFCYKTIIGRM